MEDSANSHFLIRFSSFLQHKSLELVRNERMRLKYFALSALMFFTSYGMIFHANTNLEPSLEQEMTALLALIGCIASLIVAVGLQLLYILKQTGLLKP